MRIPWHLSMLALLVACSSGARGDGSGLPASGTGPNRSYAATDFTRIQLSGADEVSVRVGGDFSVRAEGDPDSLDRLLIERKGDTLSIGRTRGISSSPPVKLFVTLPRLAAVAVAGSGDMAVDRVAGDRLSVDVAGSGNLSVASMEVGELGVRLAGSGDVTVAGTARRLDAKVAGSGDMDAGRLTVSEGAVSVVGSGNVRAAVTGNARVQVMGSGSVDLGPRARCEVRKMGSGSVRCG